MGCLMNALKWLKESFKPEYDGDMWRSKYARRIGLLLSWLAVTNIACWQELPVNGHMPPNISTLLANGRGSVFLLVVSAAQAILVPLAHFWDLCLKEMPDYDALEPPPCCCSIFAFKNHLNVFVWSACSLALVFVVLVPLQFEDHHELAPTNDVVQLMPAAMKQYVCPMSVPAQVQGHGLSKMFCPPNTEGHTCATTILFAIPMIACVVQYLYECCLSRKFIHPCDGSSYFLLQFCVEGFSLLTLSCFQLLNGTASEQLRWLALWNFELEILAIVLLLWGGAMRLSMEIHPSFTGKQHEQTSRNYVHGILMMLLAIDVMASLPMRAVDYLGWDLEHATTS
eukprot:TRINITY_DN35151_c0_g1_i2.p1 TRINITY_DN35151_c0_g1~~TRINITY_DN35151_c0_g1_i2.p1  ORF type:complete len:340 (-),score=32.34 TRINITY_DN35151_c0_g1_i2:16-1035(-)